MAGGSGAAETIIGPSAGLGISGGNTSRVMMIEALGTGALVESVTWPRMLARENWARIGEASRKPQQMNSSVRWDVDAINSVSPSLKWTFSS